MDRWASASSNRLTGTTRSRRAFGDCPPLPAGPRLKKWDAVWPSWSATSKEAADRPTRRLLAGYLDLPCGHARNWSTSDYLTESGLAPPRFFQYTLTIGRRPCRPREH